MAKAVDLPTNVKISLSFVSDRLSRQLNKEYLGRDYPTDVLSFETNEVDEDGVYLLGEVVVNLDQAKRQAKDQGNSFEEEVSELVKHGVLHLLGVHHPGDGV